MCVCARAHVCVCVCVLTNTCYLSGIAQHTCLGSTKVIVILHHVLDDKVAIWLMGVIVLIATTSMLVSPFKG